MPGAVLLDGVDLADGSKKCGAGDAHTKEERDDSDESAVGSGSSSLSRDLRKRLTTQEMIGGLLLRSWPSWDILRGRSSCEQCLQCTDEDKQSFLNGCKTWKCVRCVERPLCEGLRSPFLRCYASSCIALLLSVSLTEAALMASVKIGRQILDSVVTRSSAVIAMRCGAGNTA